GLGPGFLQPWLAFLDFLEAERRASGAAGSGSVADAVSRRLHAIVRQTWGGHRLPLYCTPSTASVTPDIQEARLDERKTTAAATSSAVPSRPKGMLLRMASYLCGLRCLTRSHAPPGNSIEPGATQLTLMPFGAREFAN